MRYDLICIGASWGGFNALSRLLADLPDEIDQPIVIAQHRHRDSNAATLPMLLAERTTRRVQDADDKVALKRRNVYIAPPDYHLLVETGSLALSVDERVQYARPSIDVLFESAAEAYRERVIGIILTGANDDGAAGLARIKQLGGVAIVQDPAEAVRGTMPRAALDATVTDAVLPLAEIGRFLYGLCVDVGVKT